jgi:DNA primase
VKGLLTWSNVDSLRQAGLVDDSGYDAYTHRIVFPLEGNLYGRSILDSAAPHRFLPGGKGGLYAWDQVRRCPEIILVEGLFDYAVLWQAGFHNVTCSLGNQLNARQILQLCDGSRRVYLAFDSDANGCGQSAAQRMSRRLWSQGVSARRISLPDGHDPNSFFVQGGDAQQFQLLLEAALP